MSINPQIDLLTGPELHRQVIQDAILSAESYVWIATANLFVRHVLDRHILLGLRLAKRLRGSNQGRANNLVS